MAWKKILDEDTRLDELAAPTSSVDLNSQKIINLADGTAAGDAVNLGQLNSVAGGIDWKESVRVATTTNGTLATAYENGDTVDGVVLATGDRILLKDQSTGAENGIYTVNASGAPTRATDADANAEVTAGLAVFVEEGTTNADTGWVLTTNDPITVGTTALTFTQFTGIGDLVAGSGLAKTGNTVNCDWGSETEDASPATNDYVLVEDNAVAGQFRKVQLTNMPVGTHRLDEHDAANTSVDVGTDSAPQELHSVAIQAQSAAPSSGNEIPGQLYYDTDDDALFLWVA